MTALVSQLFIVLIPIDCKITIFFYTCIISYYRSLAVLNILLTKRSLIVPSLCVHDQNYYSSSQNNVNIM